MKRYLVACHDAGGAEVVSSWLKHEKVEFVSLLNGPAKEVFKRKFGEVGMAESFPGYDFVLCGSSGECGLERDVIKQARKDGVPCAVYLDHWKNYVQRFSTLPDEVWVCDEYAEKLALEELPGANVIIKGHPYLEDILDEIKRWEWISPHQGMPPSRPERFLYLEEPGHPAMPDWRDFFVRNAEIHILPHPSQEVSTRPLAEEVAWADTVIGWDSMALVVALKAGRRVISLLPASESHLPFPEIEHLD